MRATQRHAALGLSAVLVACGGGTTTKSTTGTPAREPTCAPIAGNPPAVTPPEDAPPMATSSLVAEVGVELASVRVRLEKEVPRQLGRGQNEPIGKPGLLTYAVNRGPFAISLRGDDVVLRMPFTATASVCKPTGLLGCVTYGTCAPAGYVEAKISSRLGEDWSLSPARVDLAITKRCVMTALEVDVTPQMESRARAEVKKAEKTINAALPKPRPIAEEAWQALQKPLPLGDACLVVEPRTVAEGPARLEGDVLSVRVRVTAMPVLHAPCPAPREPAALPKLAQAAEIPESFALHLAVDEMRASLDAQLASSLDGLAAGALRVSGAKAREAKEGLVVDASVTGASCGVVSFVVEPTWDPNRKRVVAASVRPLDGEPGRVADAVAVAALAKAIGERLAISLPLDDDAIEKNLVDAAKLADETPVTVTLRVRERAPEGLFVVDGGLEGRFRAEGTLRAVGRDAPPKK